MSTRCTIKFCDREQGKLVVRAKVYQHHDGYPDKEEGMLSKLPRFFEAVEKDTKDTRFSDPQYLAARYLVWAVADSRAYMMASPYPDKNGPLGFLGYGVVSCSDAGDLAYVYLVDCDTLDEQGRPTIFWRVASSKRLKRAVSRAKREFYLQEKGWQVAAKGGWWHARGVQGLTLEQAFKKQKKWDRRALKNQGNFGRELPIE